MSDQESNKQVEEKPTSQPGSPAKALEGEQLLEAVKNQIEYYFSKENLSSDAYLLSHMDSNKSVEISLIMKFSKLKSLTQDESVVRNALTQSTLVSVVDNRIKSNLKPSGRSTIILREVPENAPVAEVREIFNYEGCKPIVSLRSDIGNTWFVVMESEDDAKETLLDLRTKNRKFRNESVKARLKTETLSKSFYPSPQANPFFPGGVFNSIMVGPSGFPAASAVEGGDRLEGDMGKGKKAFRGGAGVAASATSSSSTSSSSPSTGVGAQGGSASSGASNAATSAIANGNNASAMNGSSSHSKKGGSRGTKKGGRDGHGDSAQPTIEIDSANFPPLQADDGVVPTPGYKDSYVKYTFDDIIHIVKSVRDASIPAGIHAELHSHTMTTSPNLDLLQRQRTFSIDETREQLQQGKPVQRLAVGGAVDYGSMMYGDGYTPAATTSSSGDQAAKKAGSWAQRLGTADAMPFLTAGSSSAASVPNAPGSPAKATSKAPEKKSGSSSAKGNSSNGNKKESSSKDSKKSSGANATATAAATPATGSGEKKSKSSSEKDKDSGKRKDGEKREKSKKEKKDDKNGEGHEESAEGPQGSSSWGGKPTFAKILKSLEAASISEK